MLDRLEHQGLLMRSANPKDLRGSLVRLTEEGLRTVDRAMRIHAEAEQRLVAALDPDERERLAALLRKLLLSVDVERY